MDSDLLPLMMEEEDDSLIQQHSSDPNQTPSNSSSLNYFNCSPFTKIGKDGVHMEKPSSSSSESSNNKENVNSNNVEVPKLGMGPMQMKKKKKGGGYNLRKSLAWDRAFFTDEGLNTSNRYFLHSIGILDPLELTLITGINANTCGGGLPTISEEGNSSFSCDTQCTKGPKDEEISEGALRKELHDKSRTSKVNGQKTGCLAGNHDSSPHRKVTHKFPPIDRTNRGGSKVGVPGPLAASSYPFSNSNTLKTATKESKLPKLPMSKPGSLYSATTKGSTTASQLRHNLIPKPTMTAQKNVALKTSVKNVHGSQSKSKTGSGSLRLPTKEPAKKTTMSSSKATSSTKSRLLQVDRVNSESEVVPDRFQLCEIQEGSGPLAAKNQAQHIATSLNNALPEAARPTSSGPCHNEKASHGQIISDRLHPSDNQEHAATLASSHNMNLHSIGMYPPNTQPARPSGLRLPSPSLRFFDQVFFRTAFESGSLQQKQIQVHDAGMGSNRKISELRPPRGPARTPMKSNDITENVCSVVPTSSERCLVPSTHSTHYGSTPSIPLPNYLRSTSKGVRDSDIYPNLERKIMQREDIKLQYDCRGSEVHKAIEQEKRTIGHDGNTKMEKFAQDKDEEIKATHITQQLGEGIGANVQLVGNEGNNKVGVENHQVMSQGNDEKVPLVPQTKGRFVLHNEEDRLQNYSAITMSTSGQSILCQEQIIMTAVDGSMNMHDRAQTSSERSDTEKSDASKANPDSHLDAGGLKAEDQVSKVFAELQKDGIGKSEDDVGATKRVGPGLENCSIVRQHIKIGQENDVAKVVEEVYKTLPMEDDAGCSADSPCTETNSIASRESLKDEAGNGGNRNTDTRELEGTVTMLDTSIIPIQNMDTEQGNDDADNVPVFPTGPAIRDAGTLVLHDHSSAEGFSIDPSTSIENKVQLQDSPVTDVVMLVQHDNPSAESLHINTSRSFKNKGQLLDSPVRDAVMMVQPDNRYVEGFHIDSSASIKNKVQLQDSGIANQFVKCFETTILCDSTLLNPQFCSEGRSIDCIMPAESSSLEVGSCDNVAETNDLFFQEKGRANYSKAILMEVLDQKEDGFDVALIPGKPFAEAQLGFGKVAPLIDDHNHSSLSCLGPHIELISDNASVDDDAFYKTEAVLQVAQCTSSYPQSLEKEGLNLAASATEAEIKVDEEIQKSQEMGIIIRSLSEKSIVAEESQHSCRNMMGANATIEGHKSGKVALIDDHNRSSFSCLRTEVELVSGTVSVDDDAFCKMESVLQVGQSASTYPQSSEKEGLSLAAATTETEFKIDDESQKTQEMGMNIGSLSKKSIQAEESQHACGNMMEDSATIHGCTGGPETDNAFQSENKALEDSVTIDNFPKVHLEDAEMQLLDGDLLVRSCSSLTLVLHNHSMQNVDHHGIFEEQPEFPDAGMKLENGFISNHQLPPTTDSDLQVCICKGVTNVVDQSAVNECDRRPSNIIVHSPPVRQSAGQLCAEPGTSCSTAMDSSAEHNENYSDRHFTCNTECSDLALLSELKSSSNDEMEGLTTCMEYCSAGEESCSFLRKAADSILEEKPTLCDDYVDIRQVAADDKQVFMKESLSPEKYYNLEKPNNALDIVAVLEQSISHGCDCDLQNSNASALLLKVQGNVSGLNGEDQPNEPQGFHGIMPLQETYDYATNERSGYGLESSGQDPSESNSNVPLSQHPMAGGKFTSTVFCSVTEESYSVAEEEKSLRKSTYSGAEESNSEEVETETLQEGKHPMVGEFHHELDSGGDLKHDKDATVLTKKSNNIKKQDNSLAIHLPNAVPFSDEWLAAIEAAGEVILIQQVIHMISYKELIVLSVLQITQEILTMKHGAVQHSPPDKSLPEPSPWSPVKKKGIQIGPYDCTKYTNAMPSNPD
ncbi:hypothetical protein OSB04_029263 [Centaurea solstitialis]|uniref:Uncharacterized protein n=1 Tax=Centaurea solstitialis TaxID=347529 RepID=A0AA38T0V6_9ASTR|nr:hypothetical protein OSB04_029263 [Centaurea solstitialis]